MKIVTIVGARPQFIKMAVVSRAIKNSNSNNKEYINEVIVHTGQHYDKNMSDVFFEELDIPKPNYNLNIGSSSHGKQTGEMLIKIEEVILKEKPDYVMVYGDTNSTLAGALAASKLHIPVMHVEAGLRSFNMAMPEEQNRILTDNISTYLFCPTQTAVENLNKENTFNGKSMYLNNKIVISNSGDVMFDAINYYKEIAQLNSKDTFSKLDISEKYFLATIHRAENTDNVKKLSDIFYALSEIDSNIILSLHPRTKKYIFDYKIKIGNNIKLIDPVGYLEMICLESNALGIITDSGGVQKEAYFLKIPCFTLRDETEWVETLNSNCNILISNESILKLPDIINKKHNRIYKEYFGSGHASEIITRNILELFEKA